MSCEPQELWCIVRGNWVPFSFTFVNEDGSPKDISGFKLTYSMKLKPTNLDGEETDLQKTVTFPDDANSQAGVGQMDLEKEDTENLVPDRDYTFDFQLYDPVTQRPLTVGLGTVPVVRNMTIGVPA